MRSYAASPIERAAQGAHPERGAVPVHGAQDRRPDVGHHGLRGRVLRRQPERARAAASRRTWRLARTPSAGRTCVGACLVGLTFYLVSVVTGEPHTHTDGAHSPGGETDMRSRQRAPNCRSGSRGALAGRRRVRRRRRRRRRIDRGGRRVGDRGTGGHRRPQPATEAPATTTAPAGDGGTAATGCERHREIGDRVRHARAGQAAAAVVHAGAVRRLLRRASTRASTRPCASTSRSSRAASTSCRRRSSPTATPTSPSRGCPRRSPAARPGADIVDIAQIFQRSGTLQVSFKDAGITTPGRLRRQDDRQLGLRQRVRDLRRARPRPVSTPPPTSRSSRRTSTWSACSTAASTPPRR